jgi:hypothetical protein
MAAQDFFILHGEKVAVGVVGAVCAYLVINAFTNDGIRPLKGGDAGTSAEDIKGSIQFISDYRPKAKPPILKPVPEYAARMKNDFARTLSAPPQMAWVTAHPDIVPFVLTGKLSYVYVYELLAPKLELKDAIGSFEVKIAVPEAQRVSDRCSDKDDQTWSRADPNPIENHATIIGAIIEQQVGKGEWAPLNDGKPVPFEDFAKGLSVPTVDWESYGFRGHLVAAATGYTFSDAPGGEVMVANGRWMDVETTPTEEDFKALLGAVNKNNAAALAKFLHPAQVAGITLKPQESAYVGPQSDAVVLRAQSAVKFQLLKLDPDPANPANSMATVLLTKLLRDHDKEGWVEMQKFSVKPGGKLGGDVVAIDPSIGGTIKTHIDLSTPFELVKVDKDVERIAYYELKTVARKDGKPGKEFEVRPKASASDTATFKNTKTGELLVLAKLGTLSRPSNPDAMITPDLEPVEERKAFEKDPGAFVQQELKPAPPIKHAPGTGPLDELFRKGDKTAQTDTDYYEMPDGRLYYYEPLNKKVLQLWKAGVTPKPKVELPKPEPKPEAPPKPDPRKPAPAGAVPPDVPPGAMPPGMIPPGAMPPGMIPPDGMVPGGAVPTPAPSGNRRR